VPKRSPLLTDAERARFGAYLKACRDDKRLTVHAVAVELAQKAKRRPKRKATAVQRTNDNQIRAWEAGSTPPSAETLKKLAELYDRSELEFLLKGGYIEEVVPFIVGFLKFARSHRHDAPFVDAIWSDLTAGEIRAGFIPLRVTEVEAMYAIWLAFRAFPLAGEIPLAPKEIPRQYEDLTKNRLPPRPTRLPRQVSKAIGDLHDPDVTDPARRRRRAAEDFHKWLFDFEPDLYRIGFALLYGDKP
jgi:transcriptional regulator with XRE-family HTH domain